MSPVPMMVVDAFAEGPYGGNPAAVCLHGAPAPDAWMQAVANEMNLSETAFPVPEGDGWRLRWFTPAAEVALCGHATLAAAHALWETGRVAGDSPIRFASLGGTLGARRDGDWIVLDFPATRAEPGVAPPELVAVLGGEPEWCGRSAYDWMAVLPGAADVEAVRPDLAALAAMTARGLIVTAAGGPEGIDVTSRYFAPAVGIPEDPVTGSAHCTLGPWWAERLGRDDLVCRQASARGGVVRVGVRGDRVELAGRAHTVLTGELTPAAGPPG